MSAINVGIGDLAVSADRTAQIKTYALGSCVAVIAWDRVNKVAGLIHIALPESAINTDKATEKPGYFADSGIPVFLQELVARSAAKSFLSIRLAGGSSIMDDKHHFDIGKRNVLAIRKLLWKHGLGTIAEDVGGNISRTVTVDVATGEVVINSAGRQWTL